MGSFGDGGSIGQASGWAMAAVDSTLPSFCSPTSSAGCWEHSGNKARFQFPKGSETSGETDTHA